MPTGARRDRHGRGLGGRLLSPFGTRPTGAAVAVPGYRTRRQRFDDLVREAFEEFAARFPQALADVRLVVLEVPPHQQADLDPPTVADRTAGGPVPLGHVRAGGSAGPELVVYRRPAQARSESLGELAILVHEVVRDLVADLLGVDPEQL